MNAVDVGIIGGGASGIIAALKAASRGRSVIVFERLSSLGKKLLVCGGGRCNLSNENLDETFYNQNARTLVRTILGAFGKDAIHSLFEQSGLFVYSDNGRVFPVTNQASSVLKILDLELQRLRVPFALDFEVAEIHHAQNGFKVTSRNQKSFLCRELVLAGGGKAYPALGSNGSCYAFAKHFGHTIIDPVPAAVPLVAKDALCHFLQGQRIPAEAKSIIDGTVTGSAAGEVLFTKYGLSGTAILDISDLISIAVHRNHNKKIMVEVDMVPFMTREVLQAVLERRKGQDVKPEDMLVGILPNKFSVALRDLPLSRLAETVKHKQFMIDGTRGWNEAEFTAGGVSVEEVSADTLESKLQPGLFFCGEILDVHGRRGGYNLAWAWASGAVVGSNV